MSKFASAIRLEIIKMLRHRGFGHLGGSLSITDVLAVLYRDELKIDPENPKWSERDYFVLSKGHAGPALYATLALKGYFPLSELNTLNEPYTNLPSHTDRLKTPGVDMTTGSLGQGFSAAVGIAKGLKIQNQNNRVYVIVGDGELNEGQCYEAMQFAAHHQLDNLVVFVDENKLQLDGFTKDISNPHDLRKKFEDFGFYAQRIDGHNEDEIRNAIDRCKSVVGQPKCIVLDTIKGKGIKAYENKVGSHHIRFTQKDDAILDEAIKELEADIRGC